MLVRARALFDAWLKEDPKARSQSEVARRLKITQPSVSRWLKVDRPEAHHREALEIITGGAVPAKAWLTDEERQTLSRVYARELAEPEVHDADTDPAPASQSGPGSAAPEAEAS